MEHEWNYRLSKKIIVLIISISALVILLVAAGKVNPLIEIPDDGLRGAVREKLGNESGPIYRRDVMQITVLDASSKDIASLEGIQFFRRLVVLNLADNHVEDVSYLSKLHLLKELNLGKNGITRLENVNFDQITHLPIDDLDLSFNHLSTQTNSNDLLLIAKLDQLERLALGNNQILDHTSFAFMPVLRELDIRNNKIENISQLSELSNLEALNLRENHITDITLLSNLTNLTYLNIHSNPVETGLDGLAKLTNLQTLIMRNVQIGEEYEFLLSLNQLQELNIRNTSIADLSVLAVLMESGGLQDDPVRKIDASINLLELEFSDSLENPYSDLIPFWANIRYRYPLSLPYYSGRVSSPNFSHPSGFYEQGFLLTLSYDVEGASIYYTLDGSEPSPWHLENHGATTYLYTEPILIQNRTNEENELSVIRTSPFDPFYVPEENVFKGTVIRAVTMDVEGELSNVETSSYFISEDIYERYTLPVVSIVTDERGFFDPDIGIYVQGSENNYNQRGEKWERPIHLDMFTSQGEQELSISAGVRTHGGSTRKGPQKSLRIVGGKNYSSESFIVYDFFPSLNMRLQENQLDTFSSLVLRSGGNEWESTLFRDELAHNLLLPTQLDVQDFQPVILFLNGEYWGIHTIRNRYDEYYFSEYYDIPVDELAIIESNATLRYGDETDRLQYLSILELADTNFSSHGYETVDAFSDPEVFKTVSEQIDVENFIDYYIAQIYFGNSDWPGNNSLYWRKSVDAGLLEPEQGYGHDGKWRWVIFDVDWGFRDPTYNALFEATRDDGSEWFNKPWSTFLARLLLKNNDFKQQFISRFADHLNTIFRENVVFSKTEEIEAQYFPEIGEHVNRWGNGRYQVTSIDGWQRRVDDIKEFALLRPGFQREHIIDVFNLPGSLVLNTQVNLDQGHLRVNSIDVVEDMVGVEDPENWSGIYFQGVMIEVSAIPADGYQFSHWEGLDLFNVDEDSPNIVITSDHDISLKAIFSIASSAPTK